MHLPSALVVWKTLAIGSMLACGTLYWSRTGEAAEQDLASSLELHDGELPRPRAARAKSSARTNAANISHLSAAVEQAHSPEARCAALMRLGRSRDIDAVEVDHITVYTQLGHAPDVRACAASALGEAQFDSSLPVLIALSRDSVFAVAESAVRAIGQFESAEASAALVEIARTGLDSLRFSAVGLLAEHHDSAAVPLIAELLEQNPANMREQLVIWLGMTHDPRALSIVQEQLQKGTRSVQHSALQALGELGGAAAAQTLLTTIEESPSLAPAALQALVRTGAEDAKDILIDAADGTYGPQAAHAAVHALVSQESPEVTELMTRALDSENPMRSSAAIEYFAAHALTSAVPALTRIAREGGQGNAYGAVHALVRIGGPDARASLEQLAAAPDAAGEAALGALVQLPGGAAVARSLALAQVDRPGDRGRVALSILSQDPSPEAHAAVLRAARGSDAMLSTHALNFLAQRRDPASLQVLRDLATHGSTAVQRSAALAALSQNGDPSVQPLLKQSLKDESPEVRVQAVQALSDSNSPELETDLVAASRDSDANVASMAASALAQLGTESALTRLEEMAAGEDARFSPQALQALAGAIPERAARVAERMASSRDPQSCVAATQVSGMFSKSVATRILSSSLRNADPEVLRAALSYLPQLGLASGELSAMLKPLLENSELPEDILSTAGAMLGAN